MQNIKSVAWRTIYLKVDELDNKSKLHIPETVKAYLEVNNFGLANLIKSFLYLISRFYAR